MTKKFYENISKQKAADEEAATKAKAKPTVKF
jgi:hypothetical protein